MSFVRSIAATLPLGGSRIHGLTVRIATLGAAALRRIAGYLLPPRRREERIIGLVGVCIVAMIAAFTGVILEQNDHLARAATERRAERLSKTVSYELNTTLTMVDRALRYAAAEILKTGNPNRLVELGAASQLPTDLLRQFAFVGPDGHVLASAMSGEVVRKHVDLSERRYFRSHLGQVPGDIYVGEPVSGVLSKELLLPVSHAIRRADGELFGVLYALLDTTRLEQIWTDIGLGPHDAIELSGDDGKLWLRLPHAVASGVAEQRTDVGALDNLVSSRHLAGWPMTVAAKIDGRALNFETDPARRLIVAFALGSSVLVILFSILLAGRTRQVAREHANAKRERDSAEAMRARLLAAIDAVPVEFIEFDRDQRMVIANRAARLSQAWAGDPTGKTQRELLEETVLPVRLQYPDDDWEAYVDQRMAHFDQGGTFEFTRRNGECGRFHITDMPGGGRVFVRVDITELKRREEQLAAEMERLNSVFQLTGVGILLLDREACVVLVNRFVLDKHHKTAAEVIGRPYAEMSGAGLDPAVLERWQSASGVEHLEAIEYESNFVQANGKKRIRKVTANPVQDQGGRLRYIVIIGVDDTERRLAEIRLFDSSRLATLGEMATGMAHEINQPLAVIRMAADSLIEELDTPEAASMSSELAAFAKAKLARISSQTERASGLVRNLRTLARKPADDSVPFDLIEAAHIGGDLLHEQLKAARIGFTLDLPPPGLMVRGEASRLQQVIINLVLNARDALLENPARSSTGTLGHIALRVAAAPTGGAILIIEDDGPGIPGQVLPRLFEPFFTTKPIGKGTGLGLSISYDIIKRMGGDIAAENRPEGGARFTIVLPPQLQALPETQTAA